MGCISQKGSVLKMARVTHKELVLKHLQNHGTITSMDAIREYGNTRLAATIHTLRHKYGYIIEGKSVPFNNRYGHSSQFAEYKLSTKNKEPICTQETLPEFEKPVAKPLAENYVVSTK